MKDYIEERAVEIAYYIIEHKATVRQTAKEFGVSKSTIHKDCTDRLEQINPTLAQSPPIVWLKIAFPVSLFALSEDIIATCVLRYPLQHMHIAVNTATSLARTVRLLPCAVPVRLRHRQHRPADARGVGDALEAAPPG